MSTDNKSENKDPKFRSTFKDDIHKVKLKEDFSAEYEDLKESFFSKEKSEKLKTMGGCKKFFKIPWWILKALYFRLTPFRRLLLLAGLIFFFLSSGSSKSDGDNVTIGLNISALLSGLIFLFILALELKDKLTAKTELQEGRAIQKALTPEAQPKINGWDIWLYTEPANDVGGDLLDYLVISDERIGISLGDVAGKGLSAALLMAKLQSTIRAIVPDSNSLTRIGEKLNHIFYRDSLPHLFSSLVYIEPGTKSGEIKILNAGHLPPIIVRENGLEKMKPVSPALGIIKNGEFIEQKVHLLPDEYIIIYSDGVPEAINDVGEFFGDDRLDDLLIKIKGSTAESAGKFIINSVSNFTGKAKPYDDLTIAVLRKTR